MIKKIAGFFSSLMFVAGFFALMIGCAAMDSEQIAVPVLMVIAGCVAMVLGRLAVFVFEAD